MFLISVCKIVSIGKLPVPAHALPVRRSLVHGPLLVTAFHSADTVFFFGGNVSAEGVEDVVKDAGGMTLLWFVLDRPLEEMVRFF